MTDRAVLAAPLVLGAIALANRVAMAPMTRNRAGAGGVPTALTADYYAQRAGAGLIVTEAIQVEPAGQGYPDTPGLHAPAQAAGWRGVTEAVHAAGGRIVAQLCHVGRVSHPVYQPGGRRPVAPSAIAPAGAAYGPDWRKLPFETPDALDAAGIAGVVAAFAAAAGNAIGAGFDGVEIHAGNGYLIDQFLRDGSNRRDDGYGGPPAARARLLVEVAGAVVAAVGGGGRVGVRFSPWNPYNDMADGDPPATFGAAAAALEPLRLAYLHVVEPETGPVRIARPLADAAGCALILNGGYDPDAAAAAVAEGRADAVSFGKPFIANPDLPARIARGLALAVPDPKTIYGGGATGYVDYPAAEG